MKQLVLTAFLALGLGGMASAETFDFPTDAPVATVTFPDSWKAEETDDGMQGFSAGDEVAFYLTLSKPAALNEEVKKAVDFLMENGVKVDQKSMEQSEGNINGIPAKFTNFDGTDESGPVTIGLYFLAVSPETTVIVTNWTSKDENGSIADSLGEEMSGIINSIKAAE